MAQLNPKAASDPLPTLPKLPLNEQHWQSISDALGLSPQQAKIVHLVLRSAGDREIASALGLAEPTVRTYLQRVFLRTGVRDRMELAMRVLEISHQVLQTKLSPRSR